MGGYLLPKADRYNKLMRIIIFLLATLLAFSAFAADAVPHLWKFEKDGRSFHILGSLHIVSAANLPAYVYKTFERSSVLFLEIKDMAEQRMYADIAGHSKTKLSSILSKAAWKRLNNELRGEIAYHELNSLSPGIALMMLETARRSRIVGSSSRLKKLAAYNTSVEGQMDSDYFHWASAIGKPIEGLETAVDQNEAMGAIGADLESYIMISERELRADVENVIIQQALMAHHYFTGRTEAIKSLIRDMPLEMVDIMLGDRNKKWVPKIEAAPDRAFFVVGAGHLIGRKGLIALLHARGWSATRVGECESLLSSPN